MAHELDSNAKTGKLAMFSVLETPWHKEGVILNEAPSFDEAMILAGCNYEVGTRPVHLDNGDGTFSVSGRGKAIVRLDRQTTLGSAVLQLVGDDYEPIQNRDAFGVLEPLLDAGVAKLETGGTLRGGGDAWMLVRFTIDDPIVREVLKDEVIPFGLITNNHTGRARAIVKSTPIRVVCANTLGMALDRGGDQIAVCHRGNARVNMIEAAETMFAGIVSRYRVIAEQYRTMKETILTVEQFTRTVLDSASPLPRPVFGVDGEHLTSRGYDLALARSEARRAAIETAWTKGKGHTGDHSAWEAYNAAVEVIDHDVKLYRTNGSRVASLLGGRLEACKSGVLSRVMEVCGEPR